MLNSTYDLAATAQRELDALRAELDLRLAALEAALARPVPGASLERLVIDLARVATAEAASSAARATLQAQLYAQEQAGIAVAEAHAALEAARGAAEALRLELVENRAGFDALRSELLSQRSAADTLREELAAHRKGAERLGQELDAERAATQKLRGQVEFTKTALQRERESAARLRQEADDLRQSLDDEQQDRATDARELEVVRAKLQTAIGAGAELAESRDAVETLRKDLSAQRQQAEGFAHELATERAIVEELRDEVAETKAAAQRERETVARLRQESDDLTRSIGEERQTGTKIAGELAHLRVELQGAVDAGAGHLHRVTELEQALEHERERNHAMDADLQAQSALMDESAASHEALRQELAEARRAADALAEGEDDHRSARATLERRCAELDEACTAAVARESDAVRDRDRLTTALGGLATEREALSVQLDGLVAELDAARQQHADALAAAAARAEQIDAERTETEQARRDAETRADEASADCDELTRMLDAAKKTVQGMNAAVDERLAAIDAKRARALEAAEERAATAIRERDVLVKERDAQAAELASASRPAEVADGDVVRQLEAATERIHALEIQLFERDRGPRDLDVDLESLLPAAAAAPIDRSGKPATRYAFKPPRKVRIDREGGLIVDLSVTGAQVICAKSPDVGRVVTLALLSEDAPCFCQGRLLWARREQTAKGRPFRYPAGIAFTDVDEAAVLAYIERHAAGQE